VKFGPVGSALLEKITPTMTKPYLATRVLTDIGIRTLGPGRHLDGNGLYFEVSPDSKSKRWVLLFSLNARRHEAGFGTYPEVSLKEARGRMNEWRAKIRSGINPIEEKRAAKEKEAARRTFRECAEEYLAAHSSRLGAQAQVSWRKSYLIIAPRSWARPSMISRLTMCSESSVQYGMRKRARPTVFEVGSKLFWTMREF
jgi:Arm DNA-binding domain